MSIHNLASRLFPHATQSVAFYEQRYPVRDLPSGAMVTRFAPSPTGFVHMGSLYTAFLAQKMAHDSRGIFYVRIEDTDNKREAENGIRGIVEDLQKMDILYEEGMIDEDAERGSYGPYLQSKRIAIYHAYAKEAFLQGRAYPCFCTNEELEEVRSAQELARERTGYRGSFARCRNFSFEEIEQRLSSGERYALRLKSHGSHEKRITVQDLAKGILSLPENDLDIILLKSDGVPTYHFAHAIDDHLMRTTHVVRGDEWLSSLPVHLELFALFGFVPPQYMHLAPIMKQEGAARRKLSKRKDPEAAISYYHEQGIPTDAVYAYLLSIANSQFESWFLEHPQENVRNYPLDIAHVANSGALFDLQKLTNLAKECVSRLSAREVYIAWTNWLAQYQPSLLTVVQKDPAYTMRVLDIERTGLERRKDIAAYRDIEGMTWYMFDELFDVSSRIYAWQRIQDLVEIHAILTVYIHEYFHEGENKDMWFAGVKRCAEALGYAPEVKMYKANPQQFKGHIGDVAMVLRVALTTQSQTPDLYEIMTILGAERMRRRIAMLTVT